MQCIMWTTLISHPSQKCQLPSTISNIFSLYSVTWASSLSSIYYWLPFHMLQKSCWERLREVRERIVYFFPCSLSRLIIFSIKALFSCPSLCPIVFSPSHNSQLTHYFLWNLSRHPFWSAISIVAISFNRSICVLLCVSFPHYVSTSTKKCCIWFLPFFAQGLRTAWYIIGS